MPAGTVSFADFNKRMPPVAAPTAPQQDSTWLERRASGVAESLSDLGSSALTGISAVPLDMIQYGAEKLDKYAPNPIWLPFGAETYGDIANAASDARNKREAIYNQSVERSPYASRIGRYAPQVGQALGGSIARTLPGMMVEGAGLNMGLSEVEPGSHPEQTLMSGVYGALGVPAMRAALGGAKAVINPSGAMAEFGGSKLGKWALKLDPEKIALYESMGIAPSVAEVSRSGAVQFADDYLGKYSFLGKPIQERAKDLGEQTIGQVSSVYQGMNPLGKTQQEIGGEIQSGLQDWRTGQLAQESIKHQNLENQVGADTPIYYDNLRGFVKGEEGRVEGYPGHAKAVLGNEGFRQAQNLVKDTDVNVQNYFGAKTRGRPIPYGLAKEARTSLSGMETDMLLPKQAKAYAKRGYGALSEDLKQAAYDAGAGEEWEMANKFSRELRGKVLKLAPIFKAKTPEDVFSKSTSKLNQGGTTIGRVAEAAPEDVTRSIGGRILEDFSVEKNMPEITKFAESWRNKLSPEAKKILFGVNEAKLNKIEQFENQIQDRLAKRKARGLDNQTAEKATLAYGITHFPVATIAAVAGSRVTARVLSDPKVLANIRKLADNPQDMQAEKFLRRKLSFLLNQEANNEIRRTEAEVNLKNEPETLTYKQWKEKNAVANPARK